MRAIIRLALSLCAPVLLPAAIAAAQEDALAFRWDTEVSKPQPYAANAMQGETFDLAVRLLQYGTPLTVPGEATLYWQSPDMPSNEWYTAPASWDPSSAVAVATWSPACDTGKTAYRFFFALDTDQGKNYRAFGTLRLKPSPGFSPAALEPVDVRDELAAEITAALKVWADGRYVRLDGPTGQTEMQTVTGNLALDGGLAANTVQTALLMADTVSAYTSLYEAGTPIAQTYATKSHTHAVSSVDGLQAALDEKQPAGDYAHISGDWTEPDEIVIPEHVRLAEIFGDKLRLRVTDMSQSDLLFVFDYFDDTGAISWSESCNVYQSARVDELLAGHTHSQYLTAESDPTVPAWAKAASKPAYAWSEISGKPTTWAWSAISGKPSAFTPEAHTHAISGVEGLQTAIDAKAPLSAVSMTEGGTDYVWVWDPNVGTFALTAGGAAPVYPSED